MKHFFSMYKRIIIASVIVLAVAVTIFTSIIAANKDTSPVLAQVDGVALTQMKLEQFATDAGVDISYMTPESRDMLIQTWINQQVLFLEGKNMHINREKKFRKELKRKSERFKRELIGQAALTALLEGRVSATADEITEFYASNKEAFKAEKAMVWLKVIYCATKEDADEVMDKLKTGMTFEELAELYKPQDEPFISNLGYIDVDGIQESLKDAVMAAKVGDIIPPVRVELTEELSVYYVWKVMDKVFKNDYKKIDAVKVLIKNEIEKAKVKAAAGEEMKKIREKYDIRILTKEIR